MRRVKLSRVPSLAPLVHFHLTSSDSMVYFPSKGAAGASSYHDPLEGTETILSADSQSAQKLLLPPPPPASASLGAR